MSDSFPERKIERLIDAIGDGLILLELDSSGTFDHMAYWLPTDFVNVSRRCDWFTQAIHFQKQIGGRHGQAQAN